MVEHADDHPDEAVDQADDHDGADEEEGGIAFVWVVHTDCAQSSEQDWQQVHVFPVSL